MDIKEARDKLQAKYGRRIMSFSEAKDNYDKDVISTGSILLDYLTRGGIRLGYSSMLWGAEGTGKTTAALLIAKEAVKKYPDKGILYCDLDIGFNPEYQFNTATGSCNDINPLANISTFDEEKDCWMIQYTDENGEVNFTPMSKEEYTQASKSDKQRLQEQLGDNLTIFVPESGEHLEDVLLAAADTDAYSLFIIDPSNLVFPISYIEAEAGAQRPGLQARFLNELITKLKLKIWDRNIALLWTSQMRHDMGKTMGDSSTVGGGEGFKHSHSLRLQMSAPKVGIFDYKGDKRLGQVITIRAKKSRYSPETASTGSKESFDEGGYQIPTLIFGAGWDNDEALVKLGSYLGIIVGQYRWTAQDGTEIKGRGKVAFVEELLQSNKYDELWQAVINSNRDIAIDPSFLSSEETDAGE